jgi:peroxiredoxin family protein
MNNKNDTMALDLKNRLLDIENEVKGLNQKFHSVKYEDSVAIVCFSGDWDRLFAAFTIANGALALGKEVHMFFTFWGATAVRKKGSKSSSQKTWIQKLMGRMLPGSVSSVPLSKMNFGGLGKVMLGKCMQEKGVDDLPTLVKQAQELGVHFHCCDTTLQLFGWENEELLEGDKTDWCGVATFLSLAMKCKVTLFI